MLTFWHLLIYACTDIHMHAATHTATCAQASTALVKNCGTELTWKQLSRHSITYLITEAYLDELHTVFFVLDMHGRYNSQLVLHTASVNITYHTTVRFVTNHSQ